jgi:O-antigen/teichoic acid export membrane protein
LFDQGLSSASSILVVLVIARVYPTAGFGRFAIAYSVLVLALALSRAYLGTRLSMTDTVEQCRELTRTFVGALLILALPVAGVVYLLSLAFAGASSGLIWAVTCATPLVLVQDLVRFGAIASNSPRAALVSDLVWFSLMAVVFLLPLGPGPLVLVLWVGAIAASLATGLVAARLKPLFRGSVQRALEWDAVAASMAWGALMAHGGQLAVTSIAALTLGPQAAAALRGASTLIGPLIVLFGYIDVALTPALLRRSRSGDIAYGTRIAVSMAVLAAGWGVALLLLPEDWGRAALGDSWTITSHIMLITIAEYIALSLASGSALALKVRRKARLLAWQKFWMAALSVGCAVVGIALFHDVAGIAAGLAVAGFAGAAIGWSGLLRDRGGPHALAS